MVPTRGSDRKNEKDEGKKRETPKSPGTHPGSQRHQEKAPSRNPAPTRPTNEPRKDMPEDDEEEGGVERGQKDRDDR
jgi:hypothetical protein